MTTNRGANHRSQLLWAWDFSLAASLQEQSGIQPLIQDTLGGYASSKFSPPGCTTISPRTPLCSFKQVCQYDLGSALQSGHLEFWGQENSESITKVFLLAKPSTGCRKYIRSCIACVISKLTINKQGLYTLVPNLSWPWVSISIDYMSGLPSTKYGNDYVFMVVDRFSKMAIMAPCKKNIIANATTKIFFELVWVHFGIPQSIISDRDSRFLNTFWSNLWLMLDTKLTNSTTFHSQTDGQT